MPSMGPKMMALGEMDFISAQISPARQNKPLSVQTCPIDTKIMMPMAVRIFPVNGTRRLCKKLPSTISDDAHRQPSTADLSQILLSCFFKPFIKLML